jgi:Fe-S cluster assembly iron-binding protein IscA
VEETNRIRVTDRALAALRAEGWEPGRTCLVVRHVLGCGGSGYRITFSERPLEDGRRVDAGGGLVVWLDPYSYSRLDGASIDYDPEKETEGFLLDHPDAAFAAFC